MRSVKGIIIGFLLILLGFAAAQYSLIAAGVLAAGGRRRRLPQPRSLPRQSFPHRSCCRTF